MEKLKVFYFKYSKMIKSLFMLLTIFLFISIPIIFLSTDEESISSANIEDPQLVLETPKEKINVDQGSSDWSFKFNEDKFNGWNIEDYWVIVSNNNNTNAPSIESIGQDGNGNTMLWTPDSSRQNFENSLVYSYFINDHSGQVDEKLLQNEVNNAEEFKNDNSTKIENMSPTDGTWTIFAQAEFSYDDYGNQDWRTIHNEPNISQIKTEDPDDLTINLIPMEMPTLNYDIDDLYVENGKIHDEIEGNFHYFFSNGNGESYANELYSTLYVGVPINIDSQNDLKYFEKVPTLDLMITALPDNEEEEQIIIYDNEIEYKDDNVFDGGLIDLTDEEYLKELNPQNSNISLWDSYGSLKYNNVKFSGNISWQFKSEDDIANIYAQENNINPSLADINVNFSALKGTSGFIEFNDIRSDDINFWQENLEFKKGIDPTFLVYPTWDKNGNFGTFFLTDYHGLFENQNFTMKDIDIRAKLYFYDSYYNQTYIAYNFYNYDVYFDDYDNVYYYNWFNSKFNLNKESEYYISSDSKIIEEQTKINNDSSSAPSEYPNTRNLYLNNFQKYSEDSIYTDLDEILSDFNSGKNIIILPDNISFINIDHVYNQNKATDTIIIYISLEVILPIVLFGAYIAYKKVKSKK